MIIILNRALINDSSILLTNNKCIENINEPVDYILDEFKPFKSYKNKVTVNCLYMKRKSQEGPPTLVPQEETANINFRTEKYMTKDHRLDLNQLIILEKHMKVMVMIMSLLV